MFRKLAWVAVAAAAVLSAATAQAKDKPVFGAPASWVDIAPVPPATTSGDVGAVQVLLDDNQSRLAPDGDAYYNRRVYKILKPEGLANFTSVSETWSPEHDTVAFHWLRVIRDGKTIDLLKDGGSMLVLRRERDLERAMLDGRMTASQQLEGLQVGDIIDFSWTRTSHDPIAQGRSYDSEGMGFPGVAGRYRVILSWPDGAPVQWKATPGFAQPTISKRDGRVWLTADVVNAQTPKGPVGAPARFRRLGTLETSSFGSWREVSKLMAPLYAEAATLKAGSPLKAEAAAIAASTKDPKARAAAALELVQAKTRYFFIGIEDGGYVPAAADLTWTRKFGDCKGKTVLLLSLLKELGIQAEPALVSLGGGDGMNERPPSLAAFNHVIVRATIGGKVYWLDGTGTGDQSGLDAVKPPPHRWALPVRTAGSDLEAIPRAVLDTPMMEGLVRIDLTKSMDEPAPMRMVMRLRGDAASAMRRSVAAAPRADLERSMRQSMGNGSNWAEVDKIDWKDDLANDAFEIEVTGKADIAWRNNPDLNLREYRLAAGAQPRNAFPKREPGPNADAPYAVPYPFYTRMVTEFVLPEGGKRFSVRGPNDSLLIGGVQFRRAAVIKDGMARFETEGRALVDEISAADAEEANKVARRMTQEDTVLRAPL